MTIPSFAAAMLQTKSYRILQVHVTECLEERGLNMTQWVILGIVADRPDGVRLAKIARLIGVKAPLITMMAGELVEQRLVSRVPHPTDSRAKLLVVTAKGRRFVDEVEADLNEVLGKLLRGISREELAAYQRVLETIISNDSSV